MDLVHDVDLGLAVDRHVPHALAQVSDVIHAVVGCTIDLHHIRAAPCEDLRAARTGTAGCRSGALFAVEAAGEGTGDGGLAHTPGTGEQECMMDPTESDRILEGAGHMGLARDLVKGRWAPLSGDRLVGHDCPVTTCVTPGDGRAPPRTEGTDTVAPFRAWRGSRILDHGDPTTTRGHKKMAERAGFEPAVHCCTRDFQSRTFGHSVTSPLNYLWAWMGRRGRDSNPRRGNPLSRFRIYRLRPLGHLSSISRPWGAHPSIRLAEGP